MNVSCCTCLCGQVKIRGSMIPLNKHQNISAKEMTSSQFRKSLYVVHTKLIEIQRKKQSKKYILQGQTMNPFSCLTCNTSFKFYFHNNKAYIEKSEPFDALNTLDCSKQKKLLQCNDESRLDNNNHSENDHKPIEDDVDFELMFSNKCRPFIGSYKSNMFVYNNVSFENQSDSDSQKIGYFN